MSAEDHDGDSQMISSAEDSDTQTPQAQRISSSTLSPPDSQHRSTMPIATSGAAGANANGKRPINTISNGTDDDEELAAMLANGKPMPDFPTKTHAQSGYTWNRVEGEPGYAWMNKKALDEYHRADDSLVHRDFQIKGRYGDPFEMVDKERAMIASLKQQ